jgi:hypothetical protein
MVIKMEIDEITEVVNKVDQIVESINESIIFLVSALNGKSVTAKTKNHINQYKKRYKGYVDNRESEANFESIMQHASMIHTYSNSIAMNLKKSSISHEQSFQDELNHLTKLSKELKNHLEEREVIIGDADFLTGQLKDNSNFVNSMAHEELAKLIQSYKQQLNDAEDRHLKKGTALTSKLEELSSKFENIEAKAQEKIDAIDSLFSDSKTQLEDKRNSIDELLGTISGEVKSGDYAASALEEKGRADSLRSASLVCMVLIAIVIGFSLYETTTDAFRWENSSFRLVFTILLSVPAAYLARESAKHRQQQYMHHQTSLDLKAIDPYLASLPIEEQHRIKSEMSNRLFATKNFATTGADPYPANMQDIIVKLIDKLEFK